MVVMEWLEWPGGGNGWCVGESDRLEWLGGGDGWCVGGSDPMEGRESERVASTPCDCG